MNSMSDMASEERCDEVSEEDDQPAANVNQVHHKPPPDGGWGWVVCLGAWIVNFLTVGQQNAAGVVYSALLNEYSTKRGETGKLLTHSTKLKVFSFLLKLNLFILFLYISKRLSGKRKLRCESIKAVCVRNTTFGGFLLYFDHHLILIESSFFCLGFFKLPLRSVI